MGGLSKEEKIGLFGGSFDPIHFGHLRMAEELANDHDLSEVWFCPANISPHKLNYKPVPIEHRLQMVSLACKEDSRFSLLDLEAKREGPSFTIDTVKELIKKEQARDKPRQLYLILSDEALEGFFRWKDPEQIVQLVPILIGSRLSNSNMPPKFKKNPIISQAIEKGWSPTTLFNISSTEIRERLKKGKNCEEYVPKKVLDYIYQNNLYC
jgi:nicotinate-nucleotide adenylyltransferase